jgi:hypothetical protein
MRGRMLLSLLVILARVSSAQQANKNTTNSSSTSIRPAEWCASDDDEASHNFTFVATVPDRVSILRLRLEGCADRRSRFATRRFAVTIEPSRSSRRNLTFVATVPPNLVEPAYARTQVHESSVGVLAFRLANTSAASSAPARAGIRVRIPFDQLQAIIVDAGSPFYVYVRNGFSRLSSIHIEAGYSLQTGSGDGGGMSNLGAQLVADLRSSNAPLTFALDGNGAKVRLQAGATIESLQISTVASDIGIQGDIECNPSVLPCYIFGGEGGGGGVVAPSTEVLLEGSVRGTISTSTNTLVSGTNQSSASGTTRPSLQIKINDPYYVGDPCASLGRRRNRGTVRCTPTNETVSLDAWFPCTTPLDSDFGTVECSRMDASTADSISGVCSCSVKTEVSPGTGPSVGSSSGSGWCWGYTLLHWLAGVSVLSHAVFTSLY